MAFFASLFGKCLDHDAFPLLEGEGAPATSCSCGEVKILWSHAQPATRLMCFCEDCTQRTNHFETRGGREHNAEPVDVNLMWNDIMEFTNEENTKWYRLRNSEWTKNGCLDFCVAECCSTVMCGTHPWYEDKFLWTSSQAKHTGLQAKPVWAHFFTADAMPAILQKAEALKKAHSESLKVAGLKEPDVIVFTGADPDEAKTKLQEIGKKLPKQRGKTIQDYKWAERNIIVLSLIAGATQCGHLHQAEENQKKKEEIEAKKPDNGPLSMMMCCSRGGRKAIEPAQPVSGAAVAAAGSGK